MYDKRNEYSIFKHVLRQATNMANEDKAECHLLVFYEAKKVHFTMVRNGKKPSMTFQMEEGQIRETRLLETFHWTEWDDFSHTERQRGAFTPLLKPFSLQ